MFVEEGRGTQNQGEFGRRAAREDISLADRHVRIPGAGRWHSGERDGGRRTPQITSSHVESTKQTGLRKGVCSPNGSLA